VQTLTHRAGGRACRCARIARTGGGAPAGCRSRRQPARPAAGPPRVPAAPPWPPGAPSRPRCAGPWPRPRPPAPPAPPPPPRATAPRSAAPRARASARAQPSGRAARAAACFFGLFCPAGRLAPPPGHPRACGVSLRCARSAAARRWPAARSGRQGPASARVPAHAPVQEARAARPRATCRAASSSSAIAGAAAGPAAGRAGFLAAAAGRAGAGRFVFCGESACGASRSPPPACAAPGPVRSGPGQPSVRRARPGVRPRAARASARALAVRLMVGAPPPVRPVAHSSSRRFRRASSSLPRCCAHAPVDHARRCGATGPKPDCAPRAAGPPGRAPCRARPASRPWPRRRAARAAPPRGCRARRRRPRAPPPAPAPHAPWPRPPGRRRPRTPARRRAPARTRRRTRACRGMPSWAGARLQQPDGAQLDLGVLVLQRGHKILRDVRQRHAVPAHRRGGAEARGAGRAPCAQVRGARPGGRARLMHAPSASSHCVQRFTFLSLYLSSSTGKNARAGAAKSRRRPRARAPSAATASATHATLLSFTITFFSSRSTSP